MYNLIACLTILLAVEALAAADAEWILPSKAMTPEAMVAANRSGSSAVVYPVATTKSPFLENYWLAGPRGGADTVAKDFNACERKHHATERIVFTYLLIAHPRIRQVYYVTTLADDGPGSLRDAVSQSNREVRFSVGGTIHLLSKLVLSSHDLFIDGFSAPSAITLTGSGMEIRGSAYHAAEHPETGSNITIRGIRFRNATPYDDLLWIWANAHHITIEHCSFGPSYDGQLDITEGANNVTVAWCLFTDALAGEGQRSSLLAFGAYHVAYHHNIFYASGGRTPKVSKTPRYYSEGPEETAPHADIRYNIVWDCTLGMLFSNVQANVVANLYHIREDFPSLNFMQLYDSDPSLPASQLYVRGNVSIDALPYGYTTVPDHTDYYHNHDQFPCSLAPDGPDYASNEGRLSVWQDVVDRAGLAAAGKFSDDAMEQAARQAITLPDVSIFDRPWNRLP